MSRKKPVANPAPTLVPPAQWHVVRFLIVVAMAISAFLAWSSIQAGPIPGCGPDSGCDKVLTSRWSRIFGFPITLPALLVYAILFAETFRQTPRSRVTFPLASLVIAAAIWFTLLQAAVLKSFCPYCMAAHAAGVSGAILMIRRSPITPAFKRKSQAFAVLSILGLSATQMLAPPPTPASVQLAAAPSSPSAPPADPFFTILNGQFRLDLAQVPVTGAALGTNRVVKLFDYTCHHCRELHHLIHAYSLSNQLTVISLPVPLESSCNPLVKKDHPDHFDACEYARLGLAVFQANSNQFGPFSDWIYTPPRPPTISQTRAHAENLVGKEALAAALQLPAIEQQIKTNIAVYLASSKLARAGRMPQLIFRQSASVGAVNDLAQLNKIMADNLHGTNRTF